MTNEQEASAMFDSRSTAPVSEPAGEQDNFLEAGTQLEIFAADWRICRCNEVEPHTVLGHETKQALKTFPDFRGRPSVWFAHRDDKAQVPAPVSTKPRRGIAAAPHPPVSSIDIRCDIEQIG
jgi:hypothetical protein